MYTAGNQFTKKNPAGEQRQSVFCVVVVADFRVIINFFFLVIFYFSCPLLSVYTFLITYRVGC